MNSQQYLELVKSHSEAKTERKDTRNKVLDSQKGTDLHNNYLAAYEKTDKLWDEILEFQSKREFFMGFKSFQQFLGEFGWALGLFIYSLFNLRVSFIRNKKTLIGEVSLHSCLMFISLYFISWALQQYKPDYNKSVYVMYSILMTSITVLSTYFILKKEIKYLNHLRNSIHNFFHFLYKDADKNDLIRPEKDKVFRKMRVDLTSKTIGNEE